MQKPPYCLGDLHLSGLWAGSTLSFPLLLEGTIIIVINIVSSICMALCTFKKRQISAPRSLRPKFGNGAGKAEARLTNDEEERNTEKSVNNVQKHQFTKTL